MRLLKNSRKSAKDERTPIAGFADHSALLAESLIAIDGWIVEPGNRSHVKLEAKSGDGERVKHTRIIWFKRKDLPKNGIGFLAIFEWNTIGYPEDAWVEIGQNRVKLGANFRKRSMDNMVSRINELAALLHLQDMQRISDFIFGAYPLVHSSDLVFARNSNEVWQIQNRATPDTLLHPELPFAVAIDAALALDDETIAVTGWLRCEQDEIRSFDIVFADGSHIPLLESLTRYERADVRDHFGEVCFNGDTPPGFAVLVEIPAERSRMPFRFEIASQTGSSGVLDRPVVRVRPAESRRLLLSAIRPAGATPQSLHEEFLDPGLRLLCKRIQERHAIKKDVEIGSIQSEPTVSIIVPVYKGAEYVTQQIVQFAKDPSLQKHELIYVLDYPDESAQFTRLLHQLNKLYDVSYRLIVLRDNSGYAAANNQGVRRARGEYVLLLNQDVFPSTTGWVDSLVEFHKHLPYAALVGPKLLYEDNSIQHAGMYFGQIGQSPYWNNFHFHKGLHKDFPGASTSAQVPGITGACMLLKRSLFDALGGLDEEFVHGDFEDSDLSLRCRQAGLKNYYCGSVSLYHIERQSFAEVDQEPWRQIALDYNLWRQTMRWNTDLRHMDQSSKAIRA